MTTEQYQKDLQSPYWFMYRKAVLELLGHKCNRCESTEGLQIHHRRYIEGLRPWQYTNPDDIEVLCDLCHQREHGRKFEYGENPLKPVACYLPGAIDKIQTAFGK